MRRTAVAGLILGLCAGLAAIRPLAAEESMSQRRPVVVATGEVTGFYYPVGGAVCRIVGKDAEQHGLRCLTEATSGNAANLSALRSGAVDMAIVQSRALMQAREGTGPFDGHGAFPGLRAIGSLHGEAMLVLVAKAAGIAKPQDLKGKRVNLGRPHSFQRMIAETAIAAHGLGSGDFATVLEIDLEQQPQALCDGRLDVAFFTGIHPMLPAQDAFLECEVEVLDFRMAGDSLGAAPYLAAHTIAAETYQGIDKDIPTVAMKAVLATTDRLPDDVARQVTVSLLENFAAFTELHPVLRGLDRRGLAEDGVAVPLHPAAEAAYAEAGLLKGASKTAEKDKK